MSRKAMAEARARQHVERTKRRILDVLDQMGAPMTATTLGGYVGLRPGPAITTALAELVASGEVRAVERPHMQSRHGARLVTCYYTEIEGD